MRILWGDATYVLCSAWRFLQGWRVDMSLGKEDLLQRAD
jgi:hypothetical protein